jgi:uncharacterized membrane protein YtjA (UPF0391 family)
MRRSAATCVSPRRVVDPRRVRAPAGTSSAVGPVRGEIMLHYAVVFFVIAIIAAVFGFSGLAAGAAGIAKVLFVVFLVVAGVSLLLGRGTSSV